MSEVTEPVLNWPNKDKVLLPLGVDDYQWVPRDDDRVQATPRLRVLGELDVDRCGRGTNLLVSGDALHALSALSTLPDTHDASNIRLVYIDPPYNRGTSFEQYEDSLDHAVWLSMLRDRLEAVKGLLAPHGSVWVHLDDSEVHRARCVLDEVFGPQAFVATIVWQKRSSRESRTAFSNNHDYIHVYAPCGPKEWKESRNLMPRNPSTLRNRDHDPRGPWSDAPFDAPGIRPNQQYTIVNPAGEELRPPKGRSWYATEPVYKSLLADDRIWFTRNGAGRPRMKLFPEDLSGLVPFSLWGPETGGTNDEAKKHLMSMFPEKDPFPTPKPEPLLQRIVHIASDPGELVVDFFAGSGTTAAVAHKMGRRWIAIERSARILTDYGVPRLYKVLRGEDQGGVTESQRWDGGGGFRILSVESSDAAHTLQNGLDELHALVRNLNTNSDTAVA